MSNRKLITLLCSWSFMVSGGLVRAADPDPIDPNLVRQQRALRVDPTQAARGLEPVGLRAVARPLVDVAEFPAPALDLEAIAEEDEARMVDGLPPRFAIPNAVQITPETHGTWETLGDGSLLWRLRITSENASSINLGFTRYRMTPSGTLFLYSADGRHVVRAFTAADNALHGELWSPVVPSNDVVVEVWLPAVERHQLDLVLGSINLGYRGFGKPIEQSVSVASGSCNVDVVCPEGDDWRNEIPSVAVISTGGSTFCTGFMVNNTSQDLTPFFMTAAHCGIGSGNAASLVVYWNYENSWCRPPGSGASGGAGDGSLSTFQSGSFFRSAYSPSDFTLVELTSAPNPEWNISFAGWDRSSADATSAVAIHHPNTDEKRISFEDDPTTTTSYLGTATPGDGTHVRVADWDLGTTEPGSSGSPLFNQDHRVIGQLHGGHAACGNNLADWYGRISVSWTGGGTNSSRLSNWLDAAGTGAMVVDTISGGGLNITPGENVLHVGEVGGPFTNPTVVYTLSNPSSQPVDYKVSLDASFGILLDGDTDAVLGTLAANGGTVDVVVTLGPDIDNLTAGVYVETISFADLTNGITRDRIHTVEVGQTLISVTPTTNLESGGPLGGPFTGSITYTVTSERPTPVTVEISASHNWISLDGVAGPIVLNLSGIGDSDTVTVGFSSEADALAAGIYNGTVTFENTVDGTGSTSRSVMLDVGRLVYPSTDTPIPINDNTSFNSLITVSEDFCIGDVNVDMDITHTYIGDLIVELISPSGTVVRLHNRTGGSADDIVTTYDDDTNLPDGPGTLSDFNFESSVGVWTLFVSDNASQDTGTLNSWALRIAPVSGNCPTPQVFHSFPLDEDPGWPRQGQWAFGQPMGGGSGNGNPTSGYTGLNVFGYNLSGDYPNSMSSTLYLTTHAIDCSNILNTRLRFRRWMGIESSTWDQANIQASNNGTTWSNVWVHTGGTFSESAWSLQSFDISAIADGQSTVYIRWGMGPTDSSVTYPGWNIDDIEIIGVAAMTDCNNNGIPDDEDIAKGTSQDCNGNGIPDECDIADGSSMDCDGNGIPDECECVVAVAPLGEPVGVVKNRYLSFEPPNSTCHIALRVMFDVLPASFGAHEGDWMWVGPPADYPNATGGGTFKAARLQCDPYFTDWSGVGLLHAYDPAIVPGASYLVQAIRSGCSDAGEGDYSSALVVDTAKWGDIVAPFGGGDQPNLVDVSALVDAFRSGNPPKVRAQLQPNLIDPSGSVNIVDVSMGLDAFRGLAYPFSGPDGCP